MVLLGFLWFLWFVSALWKTFLMDFWAVFFFKEPQKAEGINCRLRNRLQIRHFLLLKSLWYPVPRHIPTKTSKAQCLPAIQWHQQPDTWKPMGRRLLHVRPTLHGKCFLSWVPNGYPQVCHFNKGPGVSQTLPETSRTSESRSYSPAVQIWCLSNEE